MEHYISSRTGEEECFIFLCEKFPGLQTTNVTLFNRNYWKMSSKRDEEPKGPFAISEKWPALPAVIDSAFEDLMTKKLYFFSGNKPLDTKGNSLS